MNLRPVRFDPRVDETTGSAVFNGLMASTIAPMLRVISRALRNAAQYPVTDGVYYRLKGEFQGVMLAVVLDLGGPGNAQDGQ